MLSRITQILVGSVHTGAPDLFSHSAVTNFENSAEFVLRIKWYEARVTYEINKFNSLLTRQSSWIYTENTVIIYPLIVISK